MILINLSNEDLDVRYSRVDYALKIIYTVNYNPIKYLVQFSKAGCSKIHKDISFSSQV